jgi:hypothetical protein
LQQNYKFFGDQKWPEGVDIKVFFLIIIGACIFCFFSKTLFYVKLSL